ncbi:NADH:ubiquinone oxidoreductase subunit NDUFA12 [Alteraurantiacibacter aquimixticola]|uniref:NADH:ubiquinone oxidoreductase subunit NDUFA12 n=1 Tax=Alteraurantiacibacter aquimixticola TaxID=2489173 RepID=A0A4T3EY32_9SPHN|nr:NADH:ubiquinone oxidoreductase subunit NDUFA12 [Alteraurantiacibacter aquimixticola]TIX49549.1 NADH:ubiquinone oxidoreductase subunit NDUFA12 [Alteraurantiacibacter aquimixticola]
MNFLMKIFTWWEGATIGTLLWSARKGEHVGTDAQGNKYYRSKNVKDGEKERRWVIYDGANDASRVPAEWHGWLHGSYDELPESHLPPPRIWETDFTPNATGTAAAYRPAGALERGGKRAAATGDYEAWTPDA